MNKIEKIAGEILEKKNINDYNDNLFHIADKMLYGIKNTLKAHRQDKDSLKIASDVVTIVKNLRNIEKDLK